MSPIIERLQSEDAQVRRDAIIETHGTSDLSVAEWLAIQIGDERLSEPERQTIAESLTTCHLPEIESLLLPLLASPHAFVRTMSALALGGQSGEKSVQGLIESLTDPVNTVRNWSERSLIGMVAAVRKTGVESLVKLLKHPITLSRSPAARLLGLTQDERALDPLMWMARDDAEWLSRMSAIRALGDLGFPDAIGLIEGTLRSDAKNRVRAAAAEAIGKLRPINAEQLLRSVLETDEDEGVQKSAGEALRSLGFEVSEINDDGWE